MNERGRDVLMGAAVDGVRQLRGEPADGRGGFTAMGLLLDRVGCPHLLMAADKFALSEQQARHECCRRRVRRRFGLGTDEWELINRRNEAGADFLTLAWIHCRPSEEAAVARENWLGTPETPASPPATGAELQAVPQATSRAIPVIVPTVREGLSLFGRPPGYTKPCRGCGVEIYMHLDTDGKWRPYESWKSGRVSEGTWRKHGCESST
jgi:hypothetical protein